MLDSLKELILNNISFIASFVSLSGLIALVGSIYKRVAKPKVVVEMEWDKAREYRDVINVVPRLQIINKGYSQAEDTHVTLITEDWRFHSDEEPIEPESNREIRYNMTPYMASDRTKHEIAINNVLSRKDKFHIHLAKAAFEKNRTYAAKYIVACKGQRPKTGYIDIKTTNNSATVEHHPYSNRPQVTKYLKRKIKDMFSSEPYVYLFGDELHVFENGVVFTAFAKCKGNQRIDIADLTISLYEDAIAPEKQFDSYEYACKMLEPGERHQIILPLNIGDRNIHDVKYSIEQDTSCGNKEKLDDVTYDIDTDWILNDWDGVGKPATPLELTVSNDYSMTTCHCFVNIKFYDESDTVVFVSSDYIELNPETSKQVHVNDLRDEQLLEQIVDYDVLITGNPIVLVEDRP